MFIHSPEVSNGQVPPRMQASKWATKLLRALLVILSISLALKTHIFTGFSFVENKFDRHRYDSVQLVEYLSFFISRKFSLLAIIVAAVVAYFVYLFLH